MTYKVIGLMSGSSLDGLDIAYVHLTEQRGAWSFELKAADCISYSSEWMDALDTAPGMPLQELLPLHTAYGKYTAACINKFIEEHDLSYAVDFISSHGHTVFHDPANGVTFQIGDGAAIAGHTGLSTVSDLRAMDVALGGQGAPIVPIGDQLLFPGYDAWLNLGGIANITLKNDGGGLTAFDICPCNQILNRLASRAGKDFDEDGLLARGGTIIAETVNALNDQEYFKKFSPKSLGNDEAIILGNPVLNDAAADTQDLLRTYCVHVATQISDALTSISVEEGRPTRLLATGGGVLNLFLMEEISALISPKNIEIKIPEKGIIQYKEAIVMALIGALRWRGDVNVLASVTGAARDSVGGAIWQGA